MNALPPLRTLSYKMMVIVSVLLVSVVFGISHASSGKIYYVSVDGNDGNDGARGNPLRTINRCAYLAKAGDTCVVHPGIYRETVTPPRDGKPGSPIVFRAEGSNVVVTGLSRVESEWHKVDGSVYKVILDTHVYDLFLDGEQLPVARFPNASHRFEHAYITVESAQCWIEDRSVWSGKFRACTTYDEDGVCGNGNNCWDKSFPKKRWRLQFADLSGNDGWYGSILAVIDGGGYNSERAVVLESGDEGLVVERFADKPIKPGFKAYLEDGLKAVDTELEWAFDKKSKTLYLDPPGDIVPDGLEVRTRELAFDLNGRSHIVIEGFHVLAASIETGASSSGVVLDALQVEYPTYHGMYGATSRYPGQGANRYRLDSDSLGRGITLGGQGNELKHSTISHSWCDGVSVFGDGHRVIDNEISDVNWSMTACAAISTNGTGHRIENNSLHDCGRACFWHQNTFDSLFAFNDIFDACYLGKDCGVSGSYAWYGKRRDCSSDEDGDGTGNIYHHNWIHGNRSEDGGVCLYLDNNEQQYLIHHNVIWDCKYAIAINDTYVDHLPTGHRIFNNTCFDVEFRLSNFGSSKDWQLTGIKYFNNLCTSGRDASFNKFRPAGIEMSNNIAPGEPDSYASRSRIMNWPVSELGLNDVVSRDFRPVAGSPAVGAGRRIQGVTPDRSAAPDVGAYDYTTRAPWKAGRLQ